MIRAFKLLLIPVALVLVLLGASGFVIRSMVTGSSKQTLLDQLSKTAGVAVNVESIDFDIAAWYRLQPALTLRGVKVGNPPGFQSASLLTADQISTRVALRPLLAGNVEVLSLHIGKPSFTLETNKKDVTNLETFLKGLSSQPSSESKGTLSIAKFSVEGGEVNLANASGSKATRAFRSIDLTLDDFAPGRPCRLDLSSRLYAGDVSKIRLQGAAGPFTAASVPIDAKLTAMLAPAELPAEIRKQQFGTLLADPSKGARVNLEAALKGDLYQMLSGTSTIALSGLDVGPDPSARLPLEGKVPATLSISRPMSSPVIQVRAKDASLRLGTGTWKGNVDLHSAGPVVSGSSSGAITGVDINEFLGAFASSKDKMNGKLDVPSYSLRFSGKDAAQIRNSLSGNARLEVTKGRLRALDLLGSIQRALESKGNDAARGSTEFSSLTTDLNLADTKLSLANLVLDSPLLRALGDGFISFDENLGIKLNTPVTGRIAEILGNRAMGDKQAQTMLPVTIAGTIANPSVRPDVGKLAASAAKSYLGVFTNKLLAPPK